jgi:hypothetical protein
VGRRGERDFSETAFHPVVSIYKGQILKDYTLTHTNALFQACIIAYTSDFIPKLVYRYEFSPDGQLTNYMNNSLSVFDVNDFQPQSVPVNDSQPQQELFGDVSYCR